MHDDFTGRLFRLDASSHQHQCRLVVEGIGGTWASNPGSDSSGAEDVKLDGLRLGGFRSKEGFKQPFEHITAIAQAPFLFEVIDLGKAFERELQGEPPFDPLVRLGHSDSAVRGTCPPGPVKVVTVDGAGGDHPAMSKEINHAGSRCPREAAVSQSGQFGHLRPGALESR